MGIVVEHHQNEVGFSKVALISSNRLEAVRNVG